MSVRYHNQKRPGLLLRFKQAAQLKEIKMTLRVMTTNKQAIAHKLEAFYGILYAAEETDQKISRALLKIAYPLLKKLPQEDGDELVTPITADELTHAIKEAPKGKDSRPDEIPFKV